MNEYILGNSIENQGFNTWLIHLMTLREKKTPFNQNHNSNEHFNRLIEYSNCMSQEIYPMSKKINKY